MYTYTYTILNLSLTLALVCMPPHACTCTHARIRTRTDQQRNWQNQLSESVFADVLLNQFFVALLVLYWISFCWFCTKLFYWISFCWFCTKLFYWISFCWKMFYSTRAQHLFNIHMSLSLSLHKCKYWYICTYPIIRRSCSIWQRSQTCWKHNSTNLSLFIHLHVHIYICIYICTHHIIRRSCSVRQRCDTCWTHTYLSTSLSTYIFTYEYLHMYHIIGRCCSVQQRRNTCWTHTSIYLSLYIDTCINVHVYTTLLTEAVLSNNDATPCEHAYNNISLSIYMYIHTTSAKAVLYDSNATLREHIHTWIYFSLSVHTCIYIYTPHQQKLFCLETARL